MPNERRSGPGQAWQLLKGAFSLFSGLVAGVALLISLLRSDPQPRDPQDDTSDEPAPGEEPVPSEGRRRFLSAVIVGAGGLSATAIGVPVVGFLLSPLIRKQAEVWRAVGPVSRFVEGETTKVTFDDPASVSWAGIATASAAWLRRLRGSNFEAFAINCTHLGCPVRWEEGPGLFMCPCHGGVFYADGRVAGGPPPEPLTRYEVRVTAGNVELKTRGLNLTGGILPEDAGGLP